MLQYLTREVVSLMALYFALSWLMFWVITRLPVWCQSWSLTSVYGITCTIVGYTLVYPEMYPHTIRLAFIFLAAYPGILGLEIWQRRRRIHYWEKVGYPEGLHIYWSNKLDNWLTAYDRIMDRWAFARVERRLKKDKQEAVEEAERVMMR
jgi:hypothetical protein